MAAGRAHLWITGFVQGVSFRYYTHQQAVQLGLVGWVRNLMDGRVEVIIEGEEASVRQMIEWCHAGPSTGHVKNVEVKWETPDGSFNNFNVRMTPFRRQS